jgi:hypothetical protein
MKKMAMVCLGIMLVSSLVYTEGGAVNQYQEIIETNPGDAEAYYNIGVVYYNEKNMMMQRRNSIKPLKSIRILPKPITA